MMLGVVSIMLCLIQAALLALYLYLSWHHNYWRRRGLFTAQPVTLLGSYTSIFKPTRKDLLGDIQRIYDKYKSEHRAVGVFLARCPKVLVLDPKLAQEVLVQNFSCYRDTITSSFVGHLAADKYVGLNPFWAGGDRWKQQRMLGQGGVTQSRIRDVYGIFPNSGEKLSTYIAAHLRESGSHVEIRNLALRYTACVMCDFIWGIDADTLEDHRKPSVMLERASKWSNEAFSRKVIFFATLMAPFVRRLCRMRNFPADTDAFFSQLTKDAVALRMQSSAASRSDYLDYLLQQRERRNLSHDDMTGLAMTVMIDGYRTTGDVLMSTLYYLAKCVDVQTKLRAEIVDSLAADKSIGFERLQELSYLEQCIYESLRIGSHVEQYSRICTRATTLQLSPQQSVPIEPGTFVMVPTYQMHRDERFYEAPAQYRPERFDNGALAKYLRDGLLMPFGNGPRLCIGRRLALLTLKTALVHVLANYELRTTAQGLGENAKGFVLFEGDVFLEFQQLKD